MILRILLLLTALLILPALFIDKKFLFNKGKYIRLLLWVPNIILLILTFYLAFFETYTPENSYITGLYLVITLFITVPQALFACLTSIGFLWVSLQIRRIFYRIAIIVAIIVASSILYGFFYGTTNLQVKEFRYANNEIPSSFNNFKITQITDFHLGTFAKHHEIVQMIIDSINSQDPDLVVFTGDLVNYHAEEIEEFIPILKEIKAKYGIVSILGNHDYMLYSSFESEEKRWENIYKLEKSEKAMGWSLLLNENKIIRKGNDSIAIVGVENDGNPPFPERGDLKRAQEGLGDCFKILLSHDPSHWERKVIPQTDIPLMLAGHTHGFQFQIFGFSPAQWIQPYWNGSYKKGNQSLYVSIGVGEVLLPIRLGSWPEINNIILEAK